jgi:hypothetical protein
MNDMRRRRAPPQPTETHLPEHAMAEAVHGARADDRRDETLEELCVQAVSLAAADLGLDPRALAEELAQGEIGLLIAYLREAAAHVSDLDLRTRIDPLLHRLTDWTGAA